MNAHQQIMKALQQLDPTNEDHWTTGGFPRIDAVESILGGSCTRKELTEAAPTFNRERAVEIHAAIARAAEEKRATDVLDPETPVPDAPAARESDDLSDSSTSDADDAPTQQGARLDVVETSSDDDVSVLAMDLRVVMSSISLLERAIVELDEALTEGHKRRAEIDEELRRLAGRSQLASRQLQRLRMTQPNGKDETIKRHQEQALKARAERAARARRFIEAGTTPEDVRKQLQIKSPIDTAFSQRKPQRGSSRPGPIIP